MFSLEALQKAIREEHLGGWLFFNFRHRDTISDRVLDILPTVSNTRPWYYFVPAEGIPYKIVHAVESTILSHIPGNSLYYYAREELLHHISLLPRKNIACQFSPDLPIVSFLDYGTAKTLECLGFELVSSASLIQRFLSVLDSRGIASHEHAARNLYEIVQNVWKGISEYFSDGFPLFEGDVQEWILEEFGSRNMITDHAPLVAAGKHTADPHYAPEGKGARLVKNDIVQFDLWAKNKEEGSVYADISWVGYLGLKPEERYRKVFQSLKKARDSAVEFIRTRLASGTPVTGTDVDEHTRALLAGEGYKDWIKHRTGHSIDRDVHGAGVNLDSVEFPDSRIIMEGSCFSVEPGLYGPDFGLRTEINVYIRNGKPVVSGKIPQEGFLVF